MAADRTALPIGHRQPGDGGRGAGVQSSL